jgi:hypothetical protein
VNARPGRARFGAPIALAVLVGCSGETADPDGVDVDSAPRLALVEELRIGSVDDPEIGFSEPGSMAVDADGNAYIVEGRDRQIRVFDPQGRLVRRIGRRGSGPGEFEGGLDLGIVGDTLWVIDSESRRTVLFGLDGTVLATGLIDPVSIRLPPPENSFGLLMPRRLRPDGTFESGDVSRFISARDTPLGEFVEGDTVRLPRVRFAATGGVIDTIGWDHHPPRKTDRTDPLNIGGTRYHVPTPPTPYTESLPIAGGRVFIGTPELESAAGEFSITRVSFDGDTLQNSVYRYRAIEFAEYYLDSLAWGSARVPGGLVRVVDGRPVVPPMAADSEGVFREIRRAMSFPRYQEPVQRFRPGADGALWLLRETAADDSQRWLVLDQEDRVRGVVTLPARTFIAWTGGDVVWVYQLDEMDVPWAVRMRIAG